MGASIKQMELKTVLLVDDEPAIQQVLLRLLVNEPKFRLITARNSDEALDKLRPVPPDLVLLDISLGGECMDGVECLIKMRALGYQGIVCMFTGDPSPETLFRALVAEADDYFVKPLRGFEIVNEIKRLLDMGREQVKRNSKLSFIADGAYLRSRGLSDSQIDMLVEYAAKGYPREKDLAAHLGKSQNALWKQFHQIREELGLDNNSQLAHVLTILSSMGSLRERSV